MRALLLSMVVLLATTACGPRWYYPQLDWLLPWYVGDYITLAPDQQTNFEQRLARQLDWHCRSELPAYAAFLRSIQQDFDQMESRISKQRFKYYYSTIYLYYQNLMKSIGPEMAAILRSASDAQIDELFLNLEARNRELASRFVEAPDEVILKRRTARMVDLLEEGLGDLSEEQRTLVQRWSQDLGADNSPWMANRRRMQQALRRLLQDRTEDRAFPSRFTTLIAYPAALQTESYRRRSARRTELTLDLLTEIATTLSERQGRHFQGYLGRLAEDFEHLACGPDPRQAWATPFTKGLPGAFQERPDQP